MNTIKRDVYVLRNAIKIPIEVTKGTDMIPIELNVVDYNIPDYAIAVAYALGQTSDVPKKYCATSEIMQLSSRQVKAFLRSEEMN